MAIALLLTDAAPKRIRESLPASRRSNHRAATNQIGKAARMSELLNLTEDNFTTEVLRADLPVLVDYWAPWCGPCHALAPILEQIASERTGTLKVAKVNVDEEPELADRAGIRGLPTVVLYRDGAAVSSATGARPKRLLEAALGLEVGTHDRAA
jgi:thioredoxin 1